MFYIINVGLKLKKKIYNMNGGKKMFKVTIGNSKLNTICQINLPAILSCREDAPCKKQCYVRRGCYNYPNIKNIYQENLETFLNNPSQAEEDILNQLPLMGFCRVHSSGDFYNEEYFEMILRIAQKKKKVYFLAFTKKYELVNDYIMRGGDIPKNLKIVFSAWLDFPMSNPYRFPVAHYYDPKLKNKIPKSAFPCSGQCDQCFICWNLKKRQNVVFEKH